MKVRRREFITLLGGTAAWPFAARGQQSAMPVIGYLSARTPEFEVPMLAAFRQSLGAAGFIENKNVVIQYRFARGQYDRLSPMAADLVRRQVTVIVAATGQAAQAAKAATTTIPIVFSIAIDPVKDGLVASLSRPGGNLTGAVNLSLEVGPKRLELLHEVVPTATIIALLINPTNPAAETESRDAEAAASALGVQLQVLCASTETDFDAVFTNLAQLRYGGLVIGTDPLFTSRGEQLGALALHHAVPTIYRDRAFAAAGGLMSYGASISEGYRVAGTYMARILKGEKPADLPVQQTTKVELVINLNSAKALGVSVPQSLLFAADEVIE